MHPQHTHTYIHTCSHTRTYTHKHIHTHTHTHMHTILAHKDLLSRSIAISIQRYWKSLTVDKHCVLKMAVLMSIPPLSVSEQAYIKPVKLLYTMLPYNDMKVDALLGTQ